MTIPSGEGVQPTYRPLAEMRFEVVEYLKGSGSRTIVVEAPDIRNTHLTEKEAVSAAEAMVASRDAPHDGSEMIVFLRNELDQDSGRVTRAASDSGDRFRWQSIHNIVGPDSGNSPSQDGSSGEDSSGSGDGSLQFFDYTRPLWTDEGSVDISDLLAFSLTELRSRIEAMDALLKAGSSGPHHQDSGESKIRESTAGVSRKPSSDGKACGSSSKHLTGPGRLPASFHVLACISLPLYRLAPASFVVSPRKSG